MVGASAHRSWCARQRALIETPAMELECKHRFAETGAHHPLSPSVSELRAASAAELIAEGTGCDPLREFGKLAQNRQLGHSISAQSCPLERRIRPCPARDQKPSLANRERPPGAWSRDFSTRFWFHVASPSPLAAVSASKASCTLSLDWNCCTSFLASSTNSCGKTCLTNSM